jgi:ParB-like chromosome segregation protein Spo0J
MKLGLLFPPIKINNNRICDGHHRYLAAQLANYPIEPINWCMSSNVQTSQWNEIMLDTADWDSPAVVRTLNKKDALYNGLLLEDLLLLLNKN